MRVVVVGAGASARDLIKRLGDTWSIVVIDTDPERFDVISGMRDVDTVLGDGSSAIVLRKAGIEGAVAWWYPEKAEKLFAEHDPDEMGIRFSFALLFVFIGLSLALGMDPILGAFMAGAILAFVFRKSGDLEQRLSGFAYGFLIPVFFIAVGVQFPLDALADREVLIAAIGIIGVANGVIDDGLAAGAVLLVGVTAILSPVLFKVFSPPIDDPLPTRIEDL